MKSVEYKGYRCYHHQVILGALLPAAGRAGSPGGSRAQFGPELGAPASAGGAAGEAGDREAAHV